MRDGSVLARRMVNNKIEYGWCGYRGGFYNGGRRLLKWYNEPEMVEYLF